MRIDRDGHEVVELRPVATKDSEFCFQLHRAALGEYVAAIWGWDDDDQRRFHDRVFDPDSWQIITVHGSDVGVLCVEDRPTELYIGRIEIDPEHQGHRIGTRVIASILNDADRRRRDVVLEVLAVNERARSLYRRLGLVEESRRGQDGIKIVMRRRPGGPPARPVR